MHNAENNNFEDQLPRFVDNIPIDMWLNLVTYGHPSLYGWKVILLHGIKAGACTCGDPECKAPGAHPLRENWHEAGSSNSLEINSWHLRYPWANRGIITGKASGLIVLDVDPAHGGDESLMKLGISVEDLEWSFELETGGGGRHFYFSIPEGMDAPKSMTLAPGVKIRGEGDFVVTDGSKHISGRPIKWITPNGYFMTPPESPTAKLLGLIRCKQSKLDPAA